MGRPLQPDGYGRCGGDGSLPWMGSRPVFPWAGAGGTLCVPAGHAFRDKAECLTLQAVACERGKRLIPPLSGLATWSGDGVGTWRRTRSSRRSDDLSWGPGEPAAGRRGPA